MPNSTSTSRHGKSAGSSKSRKSGQKQESGSQPPLQQRAKAVLTKLEKKDPGLKKLLAKAHGYAVFPSVGKAALVVGGSYGRGAVFEKGRMIGYATISQMTIGVQIGGDTFTEILVFHDDKQLDRFKKGHMAFSANASAVLVKAAAAGTTDFKGVTALAYSSGGMLLELALGGQKFNFNPRSGSAGQDEDQSASGGSKSKGAASEDDEDADSDESSGDEASGDGMLGKAIGGIGKVTDMAKEHPIAATVVGAGLTTGLALLLVRGMRNVIGSASSGGSDDDDQDESDYDEDDKAAQNRSDDDYEEDDEEQDRDEEDDDGGSRLRRRSRSRA